MIGGFAGEMVAFGDDGDDDAVARFHFLDVGDGLFIPRHGGGIFFVARGENDDRQILVDQGVGAVLHFAGGVPLGVNVGDLLQLQSAFEGDGVVDAAAEVKKVIAPEKLAAELLDRFVGLENRFELVRDARELLQQHLRAIGGELAANLAEVERNENQRGQLGGESFCGGHADFGPGVSVDRAAGFPGEHRADDVADGQRLGALVLGLALRGQGIGGFAGLADAES